MAQSPESREMSEVGECRRCRSFCDKLIEPRDCVAMGCKYVYSHVDELTGRQFVGCMEKVYSGEVDIESLREPDGFGGIKVTGNTLPQCQFRVERAYGGTGTGFECTNPRFFDCSDQGAEGIRAFDLRDVIDHRRP